MQVMNNSQSFFTGLTNLAKRFGQSIGSLTRLVLPFDEDTPSNDQSLLLQPLPPSRPTAGGSTESIHKERGNSTLLSIHREKSMDEVSVSLPRPISASVNHIGKKPSEDENDVNVNGVGSASSNEEGALVLLRAQAIDIRQLIRVKIADEADFHQVLALFIAVYLLHYM